MLIFYWFNESPHKSDATCGFFWRLPFCILMSFLLQLIENISLKAFCLRLFMLFATVSCVWVRSMSKIRFTVKCWCWTVGKLRVGTNPNTYFDEIVFSRYQQDLNVTLLRHTFNPSETLAMIEVVTDPTSIYNTNFFSSSALRALFTIFWSYYCCFPVRLFCVVGWLRKRVQPTRRWMDASESGAQVRERWVEGEHEEHKNQVERMFHAQAFIVVVVPVPSTAPLWKRLNDSQKAVRGMKTLRNEKHEYILSIPRLLLFDRRTNVVFMGNWSLNLENNCIK